MILNHPRQLKNPQIPTEAGIAFVDPVDDKGVGRREVGGRMLGKGSLERENLESRRRNLKRGKAIRDCNPSPGGSKDSAPAWTALRHPDIRDVDERWSLPDVYY